MENHDDSWDDETESESGSGWLSRILAVAGCVALGVGSAFAWQGIGGSSLPSLPATSAAPAPAQASLGRADIDALRHLVAAQNQASQQALAAQQAEIKRLTDKVASLSGKLDQLQRPVASPPMTTPTAKPSAPAASAKKKVEAPKPVAAAKPAEPKPVDPKTDSRPTGAISTGGAPLPLTR